MNDYVWTIAEKGITCEGTVYVLPSFDFLGGLK